MTDLAIQLKGVDKRYPYFQLREIDLELEPGQILGFVGPNGAGKSTTIRILMALVHADRGDVRVLGRSMPREQAIAKRDIGYMSEDMRLYSGSTLAWHMKFVAGAHPHWDHDYAQTLLRRFNLRPDQPIKALSHGERTKATLLLVLARRPRLLLLDEPTTGLDPVARHEILRELTDVMSDERRSILFSSQNTQDVEQISDQITFLDRGRIIESSDKETFVERWRRLQLDVPPEVALPSLPEIAEIAVSGRLATATIRSYTDDVAAAFTRAGATVREVQRMSLEEIFVANVMSSRKEARA